MRDEIILKYKEYKLGADIGMDNFSSCFHPTVLFNIIRLMFGTDGVDDKVYFTITSIDTNEIVFYGRNMYLRELPMLLAVSEIKAIDDCGVDGSMNLYISTKDWKRKENTPPNGNTKEKERGEGYED